MNRCARCDGRLGRSVSFCPTCGARVDAAEPLDVDVDLDLDLDDERGSGLDGASEVRVERASGVRRRWLGAGVATAVAVAVAVSLASGGDRRAAPPTTEAGADEVSQPAGAPGAGAVRAHRDGPLLGEATGLALLVPTMTDTYLVDLDRAVAVQVDLPGGAARSWATPVGLAYEQSDGGLYVRTSPGTTPVRIGAPGSRGEYLGTGPTDRAWFRLLDRADGLGQILYLDRPDQIPQEVAVPGGADRALPDGLGGLVLAAPGGIYRLSVSGDVARLSTGTLMDAVNGYVLDQDCDASLRCQLWVHDLRLGTRRAATTVTARGRGFVSAAVSPDGATVATTEASVDQNANVGSHLTVVGADGSTVDLGLVAGNICGTHECENTPRWSADCRWLIGVRGVTDLFGWRPGLSTAVGFRLTDLVDGYVAPITDLDVGAPDRLRALIAVRG